MHIDPSTLEFARTLAQIKARQFAHSHDRDDVQQELVFEVVLRWPRYDPTRGGHEAFVEQVIKSKLARIARDRRRQKRDPRREVAIDRAATVRSGGADDIEHLCLRLDLEEILPLLRLQTRQACDQLRQDSLSQVARDMDLPRSTLDSALDEARELFRRADLDKYLS